MTLRKLIRPAQLWTERPDSAERRVTWLELFFDLVFVAAVAQVGAPLGTNYSVWGILRFLAFFVLIWSAWTGHTVYSNRFDSDDLVQRVLTLVQMFAVAAMAANAKDAFDSRYSAGFAAAYAWMRFVLVAQYARVCRVTRYRPLAQRHAAGFGVAAALWMGSALTPPPVRYWLWGVALAIDLLTPAFAARVKNAVPPDTSHLPERFGLFTLILLGESVVAVMYGMESQEYWTPPAALSAFAGMAIAFCIWWWYFDGAAGAAPRDLGTSGRSIHIHVWSYSHLPLCVGIAVAAAGLEHIVMLPPEVRLHREEAWLLCGSVALVMLAITAIGSTRGSGVRWTRRTWLQTGIGSTVFLAGGAGHLVPPAALVTAMAILVMVQVALSFPSGVWIPSHPTPAALELIGEGRARREA